MHADFSYFFLVSSNFTSNPFQGASQEAFPKEISKILMAPINHDDIEIKPDGMHTLMVAHLSYPPPP